MTAISYCIPRYYHMAFIKNNSCLVIWRMWFFINFFMTIEDFSLFYVFYVKLTVVMVVALVELCTIYSIIAFIWRFPRHNIHLIKCLRIKFKSNVERIYRVCSIIWQNLISEVFSSKKHNICCKSILNWAHMSVCP